MKAKKLKEPVRLRQREISGGNISLYLDIYLDGVRKYEYLKMYLVPEKTKEDKEKNEETLALANAIKSKRIVEMQNHKFGFEKITNDNVLFFEFLDGYIELHSKECTKGTMGMWTNLRSRLNKFEKNRNLLMKQIDEDWVRKFMDYLNTAHKGKNKASMLHVNTKLGYMQKLFCFFKFCVKKGVMKENPGANIVLPKEQETERNYLSIDEIKQLVATPVKNEDIKQIFLFSCLTGLRLSDCLKLQWRDVVRQNEFTRIIFRQKKTKGQEYLDVPDQAVELMGERGRDDDYVLPHYSGQHINYCLDKWVMEAGIGKHITFHCARHTFATMMLDLGTDIYTVSKLLGHCNVTTTQVYAKIIDKNKQKAVASIPDILHAKDK